MKLRNAVDMMQLCIYVFISVCCLRAGEASKPRFIWSVFYLRYQETGHELDGMVQGQNAREL